MANKEVWGSQGGTWLYALNAIKGKTKIIIQNCVIGCIRSTENCGWDPQ